MWRHNPLIQSKLPGLPSPQRGKVRDMYDLGDKMLMVATDRISAFDVIMEDPIPGKGHILNRISLFWLSYLRDIVPNHLITANVDEYPKACWFHANILDGRSMLVKKVKPLPVECIVRGYISGSFWKAYKNADDAENPFILGHALPPYMRESDRLPEPIFTPSTKAAPGFHDENISFAQMENLIGVKTARRAEAICIALYERAAAHALRKGIIIADTKFELGMDEMGNIVLIDEVLTPDSSRFWPVDDYVPGRSQKSFDKQYLRDYLAGLAWNKNPPSPKLPENIINITATKYEEALRMLTQ